MTIKNIFFTLSLILSNSRCQPADHKWNYAIEWQQKTHFTNRTNYYFEKVNFLPFEHFRYDKKHQSSRFACHIPQTIHNFRLLSAESVLQTHKWKQTTMANSRTHTPKSMISVWLSNNAVRIAKWPQSTAQATQTNRIGNKNKQIICYIRTGTAHAGHAGFKSMNK